MNHESFHRLHQATERPLWGYIFSATGSSALADDLCQETYLRILSARLPEDATEDHLRHYVFRIATNLIADHGRAMRRRLDGRFEEPAVPSHEAAVNDRLRIAAALSHLRQKDRQLLWLAYVERLSHREIAEALSYREPSIRPLLHQAKRRILAILKGTQR